MTATPAFPIRASALPTRSLWIDRIRAALTVLVIFHHAAITYGASGDWFHKAVTKTDPFLTLIAAVDQAFFMGAFFLLAGYLTPDAIARNGTTGFLSGRCLRLGIPTLVFALFLGPLTSALAQPSPVQFGSLAHPILGPMWFPAALLLFSILPALMRDAFVGGRSVPPLHHWFLSALALGLATLLIRQLFPVGSAIAGFQLAYFPSYLTLFTLGLAASRHRWLDRLSRDDSRRTAIVGLIALPVLPAVLLASPDPAYETGFSAAAITYALWEPVIALAVIPSLILWAQHPPRLPPRLWQWAAQNSYAAFILHAPVLVAISVALERLTLPIPLALAAATLLATVLAFSLAALLRGFSPIRALL